MQTLTKPNENNWRPQSHIFKKLEIASSAIRLLAMTGLLTLSSPLFATYTNLQTPEDKILAKGFSAYMDGADKQALGYFEEVIRIDPKNKAAQKGLEKVKIRMKKMESEKKQKALELSKAKYKEGRELLKTDDVVAAIDAFHTALDATPDFKPAKTELASIKKKMEKISDKKELNLSSWSFARGVLAYLDRDWSKAWRIWSERSRMEPNNIALTNATLRAENNFKKMMLTEQEDFFRRGARAFYEQGLYKDAKDSWSRVLALRPDDQEALEGQARSEEALLRAAGKGRTDEMHDLLEKGLEYYARQEWKQALVSFQQMQAMDPNFSTASDYIAKIKDHMQAGGYSPSSASEPLFRPTRSSNQGNEAVEVPNKMENYAASIAEVQSQLNRDPSNIGIQQKLDELKRKQDEESEKIYKEGLIAYSQGNRGLAIQQWKQVLVINPDHKKAAAALKKARAEEERTDEPAAPQ